MQLIAKLIQILPFQSGVGKNGEWKKQDIIIETQDQYPKKICVALWGDKATIPLQANTMYTVDFDLESREFNGKWYTDVRAWRIEALSSTPPQQSNVNSASNAPTENTGIQQEPEEDDDLPF